MADPNTVLEGEGQFPHGGLLSMGGSEGTQPPGQYLLDVTSRARGDGMPDVMLTIGLTGSK